ncbi:MAG: phospho-N-acetylmuramoyl-pentapeptide-transferase, partial [Lachnospiraceae bacterium]|nr:phospho-N-acetylmuramoyl-pentapeptide-transferase [Lachnospiraceae bacterium]
MITIELNLDYVFRMLLPLLAAWLLALLLGKPMVPFLHKLKFSQTEREEGLESHKKKTGTPTMGGLIFLLPMIAVSLIMIPEETGQAASLAGTHRYGADLVGVLIPTIGFGIIGFLDDYLKVVRHHNLGLRAWQKLLLQFAVTILFAWYMNTFSDQNIGAYSIPFGEGLVIDIGILRLPALILIALATTNGTNLTDGVDGLCASVTVPIAMMLAVCAILLKAPGAPAAAAMAGALLGYLFYNFYPAKVFMGDTGSLAIGGFVIGMTYMLRMPLFIPIAGLIYAVEVISVALQVG